MSFRNTMRNRLQFSLASGLLLVVLLAPAWGQQDGTATSAPSTSAPPGQLSTSSDQIEDNAGAEKIDPDTRPLSGAEYLSLGMPEGAKNILNSSIRVDERLDSNPRAAAGTGYTWRGDSDVFGQLSLNRSWKRNSFTAQYDGGGLFYAGQDPRSTHFVSLEQMLSWRRWTLTLSDEMIYAPESPFGMPGPQYISILGIVIPFRPNQSILTNQTTRISNTSIGQAEYALSRRTSVTATASYGLLDYTAAGAVNSSLVNGMLGYNYSLAPHDTIAISYGYDQISFGINNSKTDIQTANLSYAHQVTGRMSAQIMGGAQLARIFSQATPAKNSIYPTGHAKLIYAWPRTKLAFSVSKSLMSGAGVFVVTDSTIAEITLSRALSRRLNASVAGGFADNSPLGGVSRQYRSGFASFGLERNIGRHAGLHFTYNFQRQVGNSICTGPVCAGPFLRQAIAAGFDWRFSPVVFH